ncbi:MAG: hypothetical protein ACLRQ8_07760 [Coprococcus sp.]
MERLKNLKMLLTILFIAGGESFSRWEKDVGYSVADSRGDGTETECLT